MKQLTSIIISTLLLVGCNEPPMYGRDSRAFLQAQGVDPAIAKKLAKHETLTEAEVVIVQG